MADEVNLGGRPCKFQDGEYDISEIKDYFNDGNHFKDEKHLCNYIEDNMESFCSEVGIDYKSHTRESYIVRLKMFGKNKARIDFLIEEKDKGIVLLEIKQPRNTYREINSAISQMLDYYLTAEEAGYKINKAIILTTKINDTFTKIVNRFNLPIELVLFSKGCMAVWQKEVS